MAKVTGRQWRDEQDASNYPFEDGLTLTNDSGVSLPPGLFLDAIIYPPGIGGRPRLSRLVVANSSVTVVIGDENTAELCSGEIDLLNIGDLIPLRDTAGRDSGVLVSDSLRLSSLQSLLNGTHDFTVEQTGLVPSVTASAPAEGVQGLRLPDGSVITGEVWLVGGEGVIFEVENVTDQAEAATLIRAHAVGDPLFKKAACAEETYETPRFLRRLVVQKGGISHYLGPNDFGDIPITVGSNLAADTVLRVEGIAGGARVSIVGEKLRSVL